MLRNPLRPLLRKPARSPVGLAALDLINQLMRFSADFTNGAPTPAVRTTRSGLATCIGSDGTLQWGPHNLYAESSVLITQGVAVAAGSYIVSFSGTGSVTLTGAATGTINGTGASNRVYLLVPTTAGTLTSTVSGSVTSAQLECVTGTNRTTPSDYVDSTVKNRAPYSNDFVSGGAGWAKPAVNMYPAASTLADGTPMTLAVATATSAQHQFYVAAAAISGVATGQIMARDGGARYIQVLSAAVSDQYANFDLQTGAVTAKGAGCLWAGAVWINGAWCCSAQFNGTAATFYYSLANSPTAGWLPTFTGDGINGVYIANACTLPGTGKPDGAGGYLPIPYFYNAGPAPAVGPIYGLRTDYDPVTLACKGALIEAQATNLLLNSAVPATQNITTTAQAYTVSMWGTGTCTLSGTATGVLTGTGANVRTSMTVTATAGTLTATFSGSNTNGQFEAGSLTSYIPTGAGAVVRVADTSSIGYDDLCKALPWLMDTNLIADPEGTAATLVTASGVTTAATTISGYANSIQFPASNTLNAAYRTITNAASTVHTFQCVVQMDDNSVPVVGATSDIGDFSVQANNAPQGGIVTPLGGGAYLVTCTYLSGGWTSCGIVRYVSQSGKGFRVTAMKDNLGPVAQVYYPQSSKQATIAFEGDLTYGAASPLLPLVSLENGASNRVEMVKASGNSLLYGYLNANAAMAGVISSGSVFKSAVGFSASSAGISLSGAAETAITVSAFAMQPNKLMIGSDANGNAASSMHLRRLRLCSTNLPTSTKQALTR